jgi:hypothetical protein
MKAVLILENGAIFIGQHFGAPVNTSGQVGEYLLTVIYNSRSLVIVHFVFLKVKSPGTVNLCTS